VIFRFGESLETAPMGEPGRVALSMEFPKRDHAIVALMTEEIEFETEEEAREATARIAYEGRGRLWNRFSKVQWTVDRYGAISAAPAALKHLVKKRTKKMTIE